MSLKIFTENSHRTFQLHNPLQVQMFLAEIFNVKCDQNSCWKLTFLSFKMLFRYRFTIVLLAFAFD